MTFWIENLAVAFAAVLSVALTVVALRSWWKTRSSKILLLGLAFGLLAVKAVVLGFALFTSQAWERVLLPTLLLDVVALGVFYIAILR